MRQVGMAPSLLEHEEAVDQSSGKHALQTPHTDQRLMRGGPVGQDGYIGRPE
jgi:hypothetical protein